MELKQSVKACTSCETFVKSIKAIKTNVTPQELLSNLMILGEINDNIIKDIEFLQRWIDNDVSFDDGTPIIDEETVQTNTEPWIEIRPDAEWRLVSDIQYMVSSHGDIWDLKTNQLLPQYFRDGDLRLSFSKIIGIDTKRVAPIIAKAFQIWSPDRRGDFIIAYKDGDRRNITVNNIYWKKPSGEYVDTRKYLVEDICRRIIEFDGDIDKIYPKYDHSRPSVSKETIRQIKEKSVYTEISDLFFMYSDGKIYPRTDSMAIDTSSNSGMDVSQFFRMSGDKNITGDLIRDKIKNGEPLSLDEKVIVVFMAMDSMGINKASDVKKISNVIKSSFGTDIGFDFISQVKNDYTSDISSMFRGEVLK